MGGMWVLAGLCPHLRPAVLLLPLQGSLSCGRFSAGFWLGAAFSTWRRLQPPSPGPARGFSLRAVGFPPVQQEWISLGTLKKAYLTTAGHLGSLSFSFFLTNWKPCDLEALVISAKPILCYNVLRSPEHHPTHLQVVPTCRVGALQGVYSPLPATSLYTCLSARFVIEWQGCVPLCTPPVGY